MRKGVANPNKIIEAEQGEFHRVVESKGFSLGLAKGKNIVKENLASFSDIAPRANKFDVLADENKENESSGLVQNSSNAVRLIANSARQVMSTKFMVSHPEILKISLGVAQMSNSLASCCTSITEMNTGGKERMTTETSVTGELSTAHMVQASNPNKIINPNIEGGKNSVENLASSSVIPLGNKIKVDEKELKAEQCGKISIK